MNSFLIQLAAGIEKVGNENDLKGNVINILNNIILVLGLVAVVVIVIGGMYYLTSAGDTNKVDKGKKTIIYGLIGLAICALSFAIVNFTISNIIGQEGSGGNSQQSSGGGNGGESQSGGQQGQTQGGSD